mmetsp:Transcript_8622/g.26675  ORF Transcript_8622/g.26675 Transcript_8622/m.26675 type:complete len:608 (+) Transcript_8622:406-2229(+)
MATAPAYNASATRPTSACAAARRSSCAACSICHCACSSSIAASSALQREAISMQRPMVACSRARTSSLTATASHTGAVSAPSDSARGDSVSTTPGGVSLRKAASRPSGAPSTPARPEATAARILAACWHRSVSSSRSECSSWRRSCAASRSRSPSAAFSRARSARVSDSDSSRCRRSSASDASASTDAAPAGRTGSDRSTTPSPPDPASASRARHAFASASARQWRPSSIAGRISVGDDGSPPGCTSSSTSAAPPPRARSTTRPVGRALCSSTTPAGTRAAEASTLARAASRAAAAFALRSAPLGVCEPPPVRGASRAAPPPALAADRSSLGTFGGVRVTASGGVGGAWPPKGVGPGVGGLERGTSAGGSPTLSARGGGLAAWRCAAGCGMVLSTARLVASFAAAAAARMPSVAMEFPSVSWIVGLMASPRSRSRRETPPRHRMVPSAHILAAFSLGMTTRMSLSAPILKMSSERGRGAMDEPRGGSKSETRTPSTSTRFTLPFRPYASLRASKQKKRCAKARLKTEPEVSCLSSISPSVTRRSAPTFCWWLTPSISEIRRWRLRRPPPTSCAWASSAAACAAAASSCCRSADSAPGVSSAPRVLGW